MGTRVVPRRTDRVTGDLRDVERFLDVTRIEPTAGLGVDGVGTGNTVSLLFQLDRRHLGGAVGYCAQVEAKLCLYVVSPLVGDDDDPGKVPDLLFNETAKLRRVIDGLIEDTIE